MDHLEYQFKELVKGRRDFDNLSLEELCFLTENEMGIYFNTSEKDDVTLKAKVMSLRNKYLHAQGGG